MITRKKSLSLLLVVFLALLFSLPVSFTHSHTAYAATQLNGYSLTIQANNSTSFEYGGGGPGLIAVIKLPTGSTDQVITSNTTLQKNFYLTVDGVEYPGINNISGVGIPPVNATTYNYYVSSGSYGTLSMGQHIAQAYFYSTSNTTAITSVPLVLNVTRISTHLEMHQFSNNAVLAGSTQQAYVSLLYNTWIVGDDGTYTITFTGPETKTETNLIPQKVTNSPGSYIFPVTMPDIGGMYAFTVTFNGTSLYAPSSASGSVFISLDKTVHISLYSNPTTLALTGNTTFYVVVSGAAGSPVPTGSVSIEIANTAALNANGTATINLTYTYASLPITIDVTYTGDANYAATDVRFPVTNPPIPGNIPTPTATSTPPSASTTATSTSSGTGATISATPSASATAQATNTASASATNTVTNLTTVTSPSKITTGSAAGSGNLVGWILGSSIFILACFGLFGFRAWRLRKKSNKTDDQTIVSTTE